MSHLVWGDTSEITRGVRIVEEFENNKGTESFLHRFYIVVTH